MKYYNWDNEKNEKLIAERKISFEEVIFNIEHGNLLEDLSHPNQEEYKGQRLLTVRVRDYVYLVPYVERVGEVFLKTIIPSRKAAKKYLKTSYKDQDV